MSDQLKNNISLKEHRRELRLNATKAERELWNILRGRKVDGLRFFRQYSFDRYIVDFYCPVLHLAIELDGNYHYLDGVLQKDEDRTQQLEEQFHIKVLRFENKVVFEQPEAIINSILLIKEQSIDNTITPPTSP